MKAPVKYILYTLVSVAIIACHTKRKEYIERNGLHSDDKPSKIARDLAKQQRGQSKSYHRIMLKRFKRYHPRDKQVEKPKSQN